MQKRDALAVGTDARAFIDQSNAQCAAAGKDAVEIIDGKAHVMDSLTSLRDELSDWRIRRLRLEQLDQRVSRGEPGDASPVRIVERDFGHAQHVSIEGDAVGQSLHGDSDVRDRCASRPAERLFHVIKLLGTETGGVSSEWRTTSSAASSCPTTE